MKIPGHDCIHLVLESPGCRQAEHIKLFTQHNQWIQQTKQ